MGEAIVILVSFVVGAVMALLGMYVGSLVCKKGS